MIMANKVYALIFAGGMGSRYGELKATEAVPRTGWTSRL